MNNPAGRLHALLKEGQRKPDENRIADVWAELLRVPNKNMPLLLRRLGQVISLPSEIQTEMSSLTEIDHDLYLRWSGKVETAFKMLNLDAKWKQFKDRIDGETLYGIEVCSEVLSRHRPERALPAPDVDSVLQKINALIGDTQESDIESSLKDYILGRLRNIKAALEEHHILGTRAVEKEIESILGSVVINNNVYHGTKNTDVGSRFWGIVAYMALVVSIASGSLQIAKDVTLPLPAPDQVVEQESETEASEGETDDADQ